MYEKLTNDLKAVLTDIFNAENAKGNDGLSEEDFNTVLDSLYPLFRQLGPAIVRDMHYHIGMDTDDFMPENFDDPDYAPGYYEEEEEEPEPVTEAEKGAADGKAAAWVGYSDGLNGGEKYASYNDVPDDGEEHTEEYLEAYREAYRQEYEVQYADGVKDHMTDYQKGARDGDYYGERDTVQDMEAGNEYGTSFNDEPEVNEDSDPWSVEYIRGYKDAYKNAYETKFKARPLYHVATFALDFGELWSEHQPQNNWELVKSLDSYYTEGIPEPESSSDSSSESTSDSSSNISDSSSDSSSADSSSSASSSSKAQSSSQTANTNKTDSNPATGSAVSLAAVTLLTAGIVVSKKKQ